MKFGQKQTMRERIIYKNTDGSISIIIPAPDCGLTLEQIAAKDVPAGRPYKIVDVSELPQDRAERTAWTVDDDILTDGVGADYGAGSDLDVIAWQEDGQPVVDQARTEEAAGAAPVRRAKSSIIKVRA